VNPWWDQVPVQGTDGWQFSPDLPESGSIYVYTPEVSRPLSFMYTGSSDSAFKGFDTLNFSLDPVNFSSSNAANADFYIYADGTTNVTSTYQAQVFVTQGNFYGIDTSADVQAAMPTDANGNQFPTSADMSNSYFVVEEYSGTTMQFQQSLQTNFQVFQDSLFMFNQTSTYGQFVPNVWVKRSSSLSSSTISQLLGYQTSIKTTEWVLFGLCLGIGLVLVVIGVVMLLKFLKANKELAELTAVNN